MLLALLMLLQDKVEMKEQRSYYHVTAPEGYHDRVSWPALLAFGGLQDPVREPGCFVLSMPDRQDEAFALACLMDLKTKHRINPERVIVRGAGEALVLACNHPELFAGCVVQRGRNLTPELKKFPPCLLMLPKDDPDRVRALAAAMVLKKQGGDVEVRDPALRPGAILEAIGPRIRPQGTLQKADEVQRQGRWLDASLICIDLLDNPEVERLAKTKLKSIEGAAIMELAKVEVAMADKKYKDAILRCREAARQFAWVPPGERIKKRLAELELRPEVKRALETED